MNATLLTTIFVNETKTQSLSEVMHLKEIWIRCYAITWFFTVLFLRFAHSFCNENTFFQITLISIKHTFWRSLIASIFNEVALEIELIYRYCTPNWPKKTTRKHFYSNNNWCILELKCDYINIISISIIKINHPPIHMRSICRHIYAKLNVSQYNA